MYWLRNFKNPEGQLARWLEVLGTYIYIIKHRAGLRHLNADGLSRRPCNTCKHCEQRDAIEEKCTNDDHILRNGETEQTPLSVNWLESKSQDELRNAQLQDPVLKLVLTWKAADEKPKWVEISHLSQVYQTYWSQYNRLVVINETLYRKWLPISTDTETNFQYVLPSTYRNQVLTLLHNDQLAGQLGFKRTLARAKDIFYWVSLHLSVEKWCKRCIECQKRNQPTRHPKGQMKTYIVGEPLARISLDMLGLVTRTHTGNRYILVVTDYFTRFAEACGLPDIETPTVADKLLTEFICRYGLPLQIRTDQGAQFTSDLFVELCKRLSICKTRHSPFHPQSSGLVERLNRTIEDMLNKFVSKHQKDWDKYLPFLMMAYRSSVHETLGETPCFMMMDKGATLPVDLIYGRYKTHENDLIPEYVETLMNRLEKVHEVVRCKLVSASERQ